MIRIVSKRDGFCRCGVKHPAAPTDYPDNFFNAQQVERLKAEPMLIVQELDIPFGQKGEAAGRDTATGQDAGKDVETAAEQDEQTDGRDKQSGKSKKGK